VSPLGPAQGQMGAGIGSTEPIIQCYKEGNPLGELMGTLVNWGGTSVYIQNHA